MTAKATKAINKRYKATPSGNYWKVIDTTTDEIIDDGLIEDQAHIYAFNLNNPNYYSRENSRKRFEARRRGNDND